MNGKALLASVFLVAFGALAQAADDKQDNRGGKSQPAPAPAIEDEIAAASETSGVLFLSNPGKAQHFKSQNNHIICINCLGGSQDTFGSRTISNRAHTKTHCISTKSC